jgi:hypothetical protein
MHLQEANLINSPLGVSLAKQRQQHHAVISTFTILYIVNAYLKVTED